MKTILVIAACLCLFVALALGQDATTQTVDASNANFAYSGDAVGTFIGEPTIKSANETATTTTGELVVYGVLVADIAGFVYLFGFHQPTTNRDPEDLKFLGGVVFHVTDSFFLVHACAQSITPDGTTAVVETSPAASSPAVVVVGSTAATTNTAVVAEVSPAVAVVAVTSPVIATTTTTKNTAIVASAPVVETSAQKVVTVAASTSSAASLQSFLSFLF